MSDRMSPKERVGAFLTGKTIDRVPCVPLILNHAARVLGVPVKTFATDGTVMGRANVAAFRRYRQDLITIFTDTAIVAEAMGTVLHYPDDDAARVKTPVMAEAGDLAKVRPVDPKHSRLNVYLEAIRHCVREVGDEVFVSCCFPPPFTTAALVRGTAMFARDLIRNPDLAHALLEKSRVASEAIAEAVAEAGGIPVLVDPVASGSVISRKAYAEFALPYTKSVLARIAALGHVPMLHVCGRSSTIIDLMADTGAAALSIDQIELAEAKEKVGGRVCLMGNVRPTETLLVGSPEDVRAEAERCLAEGGDSPHGFILASGCEVPLETPPENIDALMDVARAN